MATSGQNFERLRQDYHLKFDPSLGESARKGEHWVAVGTQGTGLRTLQRLNIHTNK